jgi:hypothetical protein
MKEDKMMEKILNPLRNRFKIPIPAGERGVALFLSLGFITMFTLLAGGFVVIGLRSTHLGADFQYSSNALSSAEAGIHFAIGQMNAGEIVPPEPLKGDPTWENWVYSLVTPGYESEVEIRYAKDLMLPHFKYDDTINEEDKYYIIRSLGDGPRGTKRAIEVVMTPEGLDPKFEFAFYFGSDANFYGNPVTFSGHFDTLIVEIDGNGKPYIDYNENSNFDQATEWGWAHGVPNRLDKIELDDSIPVDPPCDWLHYEGDVHTNGSMEFFDHPHFNGEGTAVGTIDYNGSTFTNQNDHYFRSGITEYADSVQPIYIRTDLAYWEEAAERDSTIYIVTTANVGSFPGWSHVGGTFKYGGGGQMDPGTYYFTDDVQISGNSSGNATIVTDFTLKVSGTTENWSNLDLMGYISGGELTVNGGQYIQGLVYTNSNLKFPGETYIFGAVWVNGGGSISGNPMGQWGRINQW